MEQLEFYQMDASVCKNKDELIKSGNAMLHVYWDEILKLREYLYPPMDEKDPEIPENQLPFNNKGERT